MFSINCKGQLLSLEKPVVMGIINVNEQSFYHGNRKSNIEEAVALAGQMLQDGAAILDIGGQSTAPGAKLFSANEESNRVMPVIEAILKLYPEAIISVDTFYAQVAKQTIEAGAAIINDISAGTIDNRLIETVGKLGVPYVLMHMKGTPQTMKKLARYDNILTEIIDFFSFKITECKNTGIKDIIIDPGFGFAKTIEQNFELLQKFECFQIISKPILAGVSRKSMIYKTLNISPDEALNGTTVLNTIALQKGAKILRVHDVKEAVQCIQVLSSINKQN